jgi:hypothetical protein
VVNKPEPAMAWATWALVAVVLTSVVTIAATINDIW